MEPKRKRKTKYNTELRDDIVTVLRKHKVKNMKKHMDNMKAGGLFDTLSKIATKAVDIGKRGYDFYTNNKKTIDGAIDFAAKYAPKAIETVKRLTGGKVEPEMKDDVGTGQEDKKGPTKWVLHVKQLEDSKREGSKKAPTKWMAHVKQYYEREKKSNPNYKYSSALKDAKASYKK